MFKNWDPSLWAFLIKRTELTKGNLEYQWPLRKTLEIPKLNFFKTEFCCNNSNIPRTEWDGYFNCYFEASPSYQESKFASLQNKILRLPEENKLLKKDKMAPKASHYSSLSSLSQDLPPTSSCLSPLAPCGQTLPPGPPSSSPSLLSTPLQYPRFLHTNSLKGLPTFPLNFSQIVPLKLSLLRIQTLKW